MCRPRTDDSACCSIGTARRRSASARSTSGWECAGALPVEPAQTVLRMVLPGRARVAQPIAGGHELGKRHQPAVEELLNHREVIERGEVTRQVERQPACGGDDDAVVAGCGGRAPPALASDGADADLLGR